VCVCVFRKEGEYFVCPTMRMLTLREPAHDTAQKKKQEKVHTEECKVPSGTGNGSSE